MAELKERPTKIRKLDLEAESNERPQAAQADSAVLEAPEVAFSEAASDQLGSMGEAPPNDGKGASEDQPTLSKSALKKLRKKEQWEAGKEDRKAKRREKHKEKQARKAEERAELEVKIASGEAEITLTKQDDGKTKRPRRPIQVPVSIILDCDFNELMLEKELISLGAQLTRCYSENKKNPYRSHLALSSWGGTLRSRFENVLTNNHLSWKGVKFFEEDFVVAAEALDEIMRSTSGGTLAGAFAKDNNDALKPEENCTAAFGSSEAPQNMKFASDAGISKARKASSIIDESTDPGFKHPSIVQVNLGSQQPSSGIQKEFPAPENTDSADPEPAPSIVYLTSDSPYTLEYLSPNTSYIIGGIVDKNRHKGLCYKRACERGIPTAKLPIGEYMTMQSRTVLAVNHVAEIMLKWLVTGDWGEAFLSVIPKRKEAKLKVKRSEEDQGEENESDDEEEGRMSAFENQAVNAGEETDERGEYGTVS